MTMAYDTIYDLLDRHGVEQAAQLQAAAQEIALLQKQLAARPSWEQIEERIRHEFGSRSWFAAVVFVSGCVCGLVLSRLF
jgi:hypothetical protein